MTEQTEFVHLQGTEWWIFAENYRWLLSNPDLQAYEHKPDVLANNVTDQKNLDIIILLSALNDAMGREKALRAKNAQSRNETINVAKTARSDIAAILQEAAFPLSKTPFDMINKWDSTIHYLEADDDQA